jgi:hypothetical protein
MGTRWQDGSLGLQDKGFFLTSFSTSKSLFEVSINRLMTSVALLARELGFGLGAQLVATI